MLVTWFNGRMRAYWYQHGYARTASKEYDLSNVDNRFIHLTNEAVQKKAEGWGKFESGNKLTFEDIENYIEQIQAGKEKEDMVSFDKHIYPKMKVGLAFFTDNRI
jgi:hypothetical protein